MTDEKEKADPESPEAAPEGPVGGERLAEARRAKQISVHEIAKELHVEDAKIRALENNEFELLGAPVFAKGHLKKYSQLVGVNHDDVLADYYRLTRSQELPPVVVNRKKTRRELSPGPWVGVILVLSLLALAYWLIVERPFATLPPPAVTTQSPTTAAPPAGTSRNDAAEESVAEVPAADASAPGEVADDASAPEEEADESTADAGPAQLPADVPAEAEIAPEEQSPPASEQTLPPAAGGDDVRLSVTFLGDCWTEITDASGRRLFFQLGRSGRTVNVSGPGPLTVLFGDADNVDIRVNGDDFTIPAAFRRGRTARLSISGP